MHEIISKEAGPSEKYPALNNIAQEGHYPLPILNAWDGRNLQDKSIIDCVALPGYPTGINIG